MKNNIQGFVVFSIIAFAMALFPMKGEASSVWTTVGISEFGAGAPVSTSLAFNPGTNEPYVAYKDETNGDKATVMKFDGTSWVLLGIDGFSAGEARNISFAFNPATNEPYVAYQDMANAGKATVMKFDGTSWIAIGSVGFTADSAYETSLAFNPATNEPYVGYVDATNADKATVMKFDGTSWVSVGTAGFSTGGADYISLAFNPATNEPYVGYADAANADKATVMKFDGTSWELVGTAGFSASYTTGISLAFNPTTNKPYVLYGDESNGFEPTVMRFDGTSWVTVGIAGFTPNDIAPGDRDLVFNPTTSEPYVAYEDGDNGFKVSVMRFDGTSWVNVGTAGFSTGHANALSLAFNPATNEPYVSYRDASRVTVMKFPLEAVSSLVASPTGAKYSSKKSVTLSSSTAGAAIYYTLDGTTPTTSSTLYTGAIVISKSKTLKAIANKSGYADSSVMSESYTIKKSSSSKKKKKKKISSKITSKAGERISPYITLITPKVGFATTKSFVIQGAASDKSGIQSMFVSVNGTKKKKSTSGSISYTAKKLMNASINVSAYDTLGNVKVAVVTITNGKVSGVRYY